MRLIDADALRRRKELRFSLMAAITTIQFLIDEAPTVEERKHGYWKGKPLAGYCTVRCSYCRVSFEGNSGRWKYCPECGAKMDGVNDGCF